MNTTDLEWPTLFDPDETKIEHVDDVIDIMPIATQKNTLEDALHELEFLNKRLAGKLELLVGFPEFELEMQKLIVDDRGTRQGFPKETFQLLLLIRSLHEERFGLMMIEHDKWKLNLEK